VGTAPGRLISISIGDVPEVDVFIRNQERAAQRTRIPFEKVS